MTQQRVAVWLKAIQYGDGNIGSDTEFDISVNGETIHLDADIRNGTTRWFNKPVFDQPVQDGEVRVSIAVKVTEERELYPDVGQSRKDYLIERIYGRQELGPLTVRVQENWGVFRAGPTATFVFTFEAEYFTDAVTACCWNGIVDDTKTLASYYAQTDRHRLMADYIAGACAKFNLQAVIGHAIGAIEDGISKERADNWMQVSKEVIEEEFIRYWRKNKATEVPEPKLDHVLKFDVLNAAAGIWYLSNRSPGNFGDGGISYKTAMYKAMQYNWGPENTWPDDKASCKPGRWDADFRPSAYAWTMAFLAWGSGFAVPDIRYTSQYARYADSPTWEQYKWLSPLKATCKQNAHLPIPDFTPTYAPQHSPYGRHVRTGKQIVILARETPEQTDHDYISALAVALHIQQTFPGSVAPVVTADSYFACDSMKEANTKKKVCVIVLGPGAREDVHRVFPEAGAYPGFAAWSEGTADGYIDAAGGVSRTENYLKARDEAAAAYKVWISGASAFHLAGAGNANPG